MAEFVTTPIARAIVDQNRAVDDRRADGVVKTHTCWNVPVYREPLPATVIAELLDKYYHPYHRRLSNPSTNSIQLCVDCHAMAGVGPLIGPDTRQKRPAVCLGDGAGTSLPAGWIDVLEQCFRESFGEFDVTVNDPFSGGYITRTHSQERPWLQIELSRAPFLPNVAKRDRVLQALGRFCEKTL
jgi:formiminoglutamase